jgi:hypothetical protein
MEICRGLMISVYSDSRNRVSQNQATTPETGFLRQYLITTHQPRKNPVSPPDITLFSDSVPSVASAVKSFRNRGETTDGGEVELIVKLSPTGKIVIITVYVP